MGRPSGTKNNMRTPEEKEAIILKFLESGLGTLSFSKKYMIDRRVLMKWVQKYNEAGIEGLKSRTGKCAKKGITGRPKKVQTKEEELERENLKLRIEIERLKKGYYVKGVGQRKEYISINSRSLESSKN